MNPKIESVLEKLTELVALARTKYTKPTSGIPASDLSQAVNQSLNKANSAVQDSGYVHTDNNFTTPEKTKLAGLSNYDDTAVRNLITGKQDKLVAGDNITIDEETNTISTSGGGMTITDIDTDTEYKISLFLAENKPILRITEVEENA